MKNLNILVTTDFSDNSYKAFDAAIKMAELFNGTITTLFISEPKSELSINEIIPGYAADDNNTAMDRLRKYMKSLSKEKLGNHFSGEAIIKSGYPPKIITQVSADYDLLVMAAHGRSRLSRLLVGSVTEKVIHDSRIPVLVVKRKSGPLKLEKLMVTTDMSFTSTLAFPYAVSLAAKAHADVDLVHAISYENFEWLSQIQSFIQEQKGNLQEYKNEYFKTIADQVETRLLFSNRSIHDELIRQINDEKYSMVVMATLGKTGLDYLRLGSVAYNILRYTQTPVFLIPAKRVK